MIINKLKFVLIAIAVLLVDLKGVCQSNTLYFMDMIHQNNYLNPAYQSNCNGFLGLPVFSGTSIDFANSAFDYNDLIHNGTGKLRDSLVIDFNNVKSKLTSNNYTYINTQIPILGLGFWVRNSYFTFSISTRANFRLSFPGTLINMVDGNGNYIGNNNPLVINGVGLTAINYNEFAFGLSKRITHRLVIGGKLKVLAGNGAIESKNNTIKLYTQPDTYAMRLESDIKVNVSAPVTFVYDKDGNITDINTDNSGSVNSFINGENMGLALDMGASYRLNDHFSFYASVIDLGYITWKRNVNNLVNNGSFEFDGLKLDSIWTNSDYNEFSQVADSLANFFKFKTTQNKFTTYLNSGIYLGTTYDVGNFMNFGLLSRTSFYSGKINESVTISANFKPVKWFGTSISYSYISKEYRNIGLGVCLRTGPMQFYVVTDNINVAFKPKDAKVAKVQLGINFYFGCGKRENFSLMKDKMPAKSTDFM